MQRYSQGLWSDSKILRDNSAHYTSAELLCGWQTLQHHYVLLPPNPQTGWYPHLRKQSCFSILWSLRSHWTQSGQKYSKRPKSKWTELNLLKWYSLWSRTVVWDVSIWLLSSRNCLLSEGKNTGIQVGCCSRHPRVRDLSFPHLDPLGSGNSSPLGLHQALGRSSSLSLEQGWAYILCFKNILDKMFLPKLLYRYMTFW